MRDSCLIRFGLLFISLAKFAAAQNQAIPHAQDKPPNEPRAPQTAAKMMTVPKGFVVDVVAHEPDIVNPVAMTFDEKGRVWITESLEYPRKEPGPGKDRVKILEDIDGDGTMDTFTVFLDGLNIPSGVAVGHGGVWIANSPDILFVPDKDRDGKPDGPAEVVVTGFGRTDTHELPNSLAWGPDGWLYGLNGVFNHSHVKYPENNPNFKPDHPGWPLTCAMYRIHPRTREFQVFAEGTSNPWGIAFNDEGEAFVSACVIDHLWHIVETGYYHRQGGPYPPHTWKIDSIVEHKHQKAAYCGITWFDSDAYPEQFRRKLYMGNIHGGCINVDRIERNGSTYKGFGELDFLTANDAWFMPVVQKTGPDGCLWILDWYDRYHCYQDANRDPAGIDRLKGRLYRVRYVDQSRDVLSRSDATRGGSFDLAKETDDQLIEKLGHPNVWMRETAQRVLQERLPTADDETATTVLARLEAAFLAENIDRETRLRSFCVAYGSGQLPIGKMHQLESSPDDLLRSWSVRALRTAVNPRLGPLLANGKKRIFRPQLKFDDPSPIVRLQLAISAGDAFRNSSVLLKPNLESFIELLDGADDDPHLQRIVWANLHPVLRTNEGLADQLILDPLAKRPDSPVFQQLPRVVSYVMDHPVNGAPLSKAFRLIDYASRIPEYDARPLVEQVTQHVQTHPSLKSREDFRGELLRFVLPWVQNDNHALNFEGALLLASVETTDRTVRARAIRQVQKIADSTDSEHGHRIRAIDALISSNDQSVIEILGNLLTEKSNSSFLKSQILQSAGRLDDAKVAEAVLANYATLPAEVQPKAVELLTQRAGWAKSLLAAIGEKQLSADVININQARRLHELKDEELSKLLKDHWGEIRDGRNPDRERIVAEMKTYIREHKGDESNGEKVFKKACGQCHKLFGEGAEVGPDITRNGRNDYQQLLSNVFDPSLVIGAGYRSYTVLTNGGRVVNGLLAEESPQRVVLKVQGGKQEIIPRDDIDEFKVSELSLMPEQLEKQITPTEIADLFAYITLDKPPIDSEAKRLAGVYEIVPRETTNPNEFAAVFQEVAPGFTSITSGEGGVALLAEHRGKKGVVRTHPVNKDKSAIMRGKFTIPADKKTTLAIEVSHDARGDWRLLAGGQGERLLDEIVSEETCKDGWAKFEVDLSKFAGKEIEVQLWNQANNWAWEFGYWGAVKIVSE